VLVLQPAAVGVSGRAPGHPGGRGTLVAISPQTPDQSLTLAERHAIEYPVLSDAGNAVAKQDGLLFTAAESVTDTMRKLGISLDEYNGDGAQTLRHTAEGRPMGIASPRANRRTSVTAPLKEIDSVSRLEMDGAGCGQATSI
jgi:hypothetical protein